MSASAAVLSSVELASGDSLREAERGSPVPPPRPVIIFDWDDTLLASSWLTMQRLQLDSYEIPEASMSELRSLERQIIAVLSRACEVGQVVIITNAQMGWVELSARRFVPNVVPLLAKVRVVSARTTYEPQFPGSPLDWKLQAFRSEIGLLFEGATLDGQCQSVISFGDSVHERDAVQHVGASLVGAWTKSVKFVEQPSIQQLRREIELVCQWFDYIAHHPNHLNLVFNLQNVLVTQQS